MEEISKGRRHCKHFFGPDCKRLKNKVYPVEGTWRLGSEGKGFISQTVH